MRPYLFILTLFIALGLAGCNGQSTETAAVVEPTSTATPMPPTATVTATITATPPPTDTPPPTSTATPTATATAQPTITPTPTPELRLSLDEVYNVPAAGFSFIPPPLYRVDIQGRQVALFDPTGNIIISLMGIPDYTEETDHEAIIDEFLDDVAQAGNGEFKQTGSQPITIDEREGLLVDVTGTLFNAPVAGQAVAVFYPDEVFFFGLAIANLSQDTQQWDNEGRAAFETILAHVHFLTDLDQLVCPIATDDTYGYTAENPIRVGGGAFGGPSRGRAYLDNLLGPNGEALTYQRIGSEPIEDTILDIYQISGLAQPVQLYLDSYNSELLQAPVGFTCASFFP